MDQFLVSMINELYISEATTLKYEYIYIYIYVCLQSRPFLHTNRWPETKVCYNTIEKVWLGQGAVIEN
jgi:hypothetical protein